MKAIEKSVIPWCAKYQWLGKKAFLVGTVVLESSLMDHEVRSALDSEFEKILGEILPDGLERPALIQYLPGSLFFVPREG